MKRLSRRTFVKLGAAGAGLAALGVGMPGFLGAEELVPGGRGVSRTTGAPRQAIATTCLQCPARCGILGFVEEGRLAKIEGNPGDPNNQGRICAKGQAGLNQLYNPDRLLYPLRRAGPRGAGVWQRIPWDLAFQEVAARLAEIRQGGHPEEIVFMAGLLEGDQSVVRRFAQALGTPRLGDEMYLYQGNKRMAQELTWGAPLEVNDLANARYILNFGTNPYDSHTFYVPLAQRLIEGRMNGARLVTFDPRLSNTAAKSDEWYPISPGTDAVVALAMANVIMQRGLQDQDFLERWCNYPADRLATYLAQFTPDRAGWMSGVSPSHIERIAVEFATRKPSTTLSAGGVSLHAHGVQSERALALLNAVAGNVDVKGGYCLPRTYDLAEPEPQPPPPKGLPLNPDQWSRLFSHIKARELKVGALLTYMANPAYSYPDHQLTAQVLQDQELVPFYAAIDSYVTEASVMADIILPGATYLESWDLHSVPAYNLVPYVSIMQPVVKPLAESLPFHDIAIELARRIGGGVERYFDFGSMEGYLSAAIARVPGLERAGGLKYLKEKGLWLDSTARPVYRSFEKEGFKTPSGKFEVYSRALEARGFSALPSFEPPAREGRDETLTLVTFQWNVHTYGRTAPCMWLSEIAHDNPVWVHPETAAARGIRKGDQVKITSPAGSLTARAWITQGIHPRVLAMGACVGHWQSGRVAQGKSFKSPDPNTQLIWWEKHGNGVHPYRLVPLDIDPVGGSPAWMDAQVTLEKA